MNTLLDRLSVVVTGRTTSLFARDYEQRREEIARRLRQARVLVIGGAGSIGAATVGAALDFPLRALHVVDQCENGLAELVRSLRSATSPRPIPQDFRTIVLDFGSPIMQRLLEDEAPYDFVLNFAAVKHVRSEKDVPCLLHMFDTNVVKPARLLGWLNARDERTEYFCVSTDKAANPVGLMGASKRLMEHVIFGAGGASGSPRRATSARFANVAFSNGSLLQSFLRRIENRQPLAAPASTRRFFVSLREAGEICLLAAVCAPDRHLLIPRLSPEQDLRCLEEVAKAIIREFGFEPAIYDDENAAKAAFDRDFQRGSYPLVLTPLDTSGEKPYEEFIGAGERAVELGMGALLGVPYAAAEPSRVAALVRALEQWIGDPRHAVSRKALAEAVAEVLVEFHHADRNHCLDDRM